MIQDHTSRVNSTIHNANRTAANKLIREAVGTKIDAVIDYAADPVIGADSAPLDPTVFLDGLHPTQASQNKMAVIYTAALDNLFAHIAP